MDHINPYRLEMGTNIKELLGKSLHDFWQKIIMDELKALES